MLEIHPRQNLLKSDLIKRYGNIDTSSIGHLTTDGYIHNIKAQTISKKMVGPIMTVHLHEMDGSALYHALVNSQAGDVLVISMPECEDYACWGELRTIAAMSKGLAGIVTNGCVTDLAALQEFPLPVFSKGVSAITTRKLDLGGQINSNMIFEGIEIKPGYLAIGDTDGLFILSDIQAGKLIDQVEKKQEVDRIKRQKLLGSICMS